MAAIAGEAEARDAIRQARPGVEVVAGLLGAIYYAVAERAVRELLFEKGIIEPDEFRQAIEWYDRTDPGLGASIVARAWSETEFRDSLLNRPMETVA